MRRTPRGKPA